MARKTLDIFSLGIILIGVYLFLDITSMFELFRNICGIVGSIIVIITQTIFLKDSRRKKNG